MANDFTYVQTVRKLLMLFCILCFVKFFPQEYNYSEYFPLRENIQSSSVSETDRNKLLKVFLQKAKSENNFEEISGAYDLYSIYSKNPDIKLKYADSSIIAAKKFGDLTTIGQQILAKGSILYINFRDYQKALSQFLTAQKYLENPEDNFGVYSKYKNLYHIATCKAYLGDYSEAISIYNQCLNFYKPALYSKDHPNNLYNFRKGYINCLIQSAFCYQNLGKNDEADKRIMEALENLPPSEFENEQAYLQQLRGISLYKTSRYGDALKNFSESSKRLISEGDFGRLQFNNLYTAKSYVAMHEITKAVQYFQKNDSIFNKQKFLFPQAREGYEFLINYYAKSGDKDRQLYYTNQLLKADRILERDFKDLSSRIHKEFDTVKLISERNRLQSRSSGLYWLVGALAVAAFVLLLLYVFSMRRQKELKAKYAELEAQFQNQTNTQLIADSQDSLPLEESEVRKVTHEADWKILGMLSEFEKGTAFTQKGLTVAQLAESLGVSGTDLSRVINESKGMNFSRYLSTLRIRYITALLFSEKKYLDYKIEALAQECGIASRQNFSDLFMEINGMRPKDFIALRKKELLQQ